uniref:Uncharacterized protein n=4 Tax=Aegilops tauschii subsp. strangulata TaxID=200361 RepID=A0A453JXQ0_AEGTS
HTCHLIIQASASMIYTVDATGYVYTVLTIAVELNLITQMVCKTKPYHVLTAQCADLHSLHQIIAKIDAQMTGTREEFDSEEKICVVMVNERAQRGGRPCYSSSLRKVHQYRRRVAQAL